MGYLYILYMGGFKILNHISDAFHERCHNCLPQLQRLIYATLFL